MPQVSEKEQLSKINKKRILREIKDIQQTPIDPDNSIYESSPGCYVCINDADINNHQIMIIGPEGTPYENGFYMFDFTYNKNHPFEAPYVKYLTTDGTVRFNPNLYSNGKVCLSILGTWAGPAWEPTMSLRVVCEYLRSILTENPIQNEPGFENCLDNQCKMYNKYVTSENYHLAIYKNLFKLPELLKPFHKTINLKFIENFNKIVNKLQKLDDIDKYLGQKISPYHRDLRYSIKNSITFINSQFLALYYCSTNNLFKEKQLYEYDLIKDVFNKNKTFILFELVKLCIVNINKNPQKEFSHPQIIASIYNHLSKYKGNVNSFLNLEKFIIQHYNMYNPNLTFKDYIKIEINKDILFDLTLELILENIPSYDYPKKINISNGEKSLYCSINDIVNINDLND